ncbi:MAG: hypothetical protein VKJ06_08630 [Vampirovibrionales bacterium]|nr:hypothetical protein [Vampirovibrionales bacterium]
MSAINTTASHIFKLLGWLSHHPMTADEILAQFRQDTNRSISSDSVWLYLNTLRALGCLISRPTPSNQFKHELNFNAFSVYLTDSDLRALIEAKAALETHGASYQEQLWFDQFVKALMRQSCYLEELAQTSQEAPANDLGGVSHEVSLFETSQSAQLLLEDYFAKSRSVDYEPYQPLIQALESAILQSSWLKIYYKTGSGRKLCFECTPPERLMYKGGVLYLVGDANHTRLCLSGSEPQGANAEAPLLTLEHELEAPVSSSIDQAKTLDDKWLRVERIIGIEPLSAESKELWMPSDWGTAELSPINPVTTLAAASAPDAETPEALAAMQSPSAQALTLAKPADTPENDLPLVYEIDYSQLGGITTERVIVRYALQDALKLEPFYMKESMRWIKAPQGDAWQLEVCFDTSDLFTLKQRLLEQGIPFKVVGPMVFKQDLQQAVSQMVARYA